MDPLRSGRGTRAPTAFTSPGAQTESRPSTHNERSHDGALPLFAPLSISEVQP